MFWVPSDIAHQGQRCEGPAPVQTTSTREALNGRCSLNEQSSSEASTSSVIVILSFTD
jgi:hypothetical protein